VDIQRLRNLTTGRLHTQMSDIYEDIAFLLGEEGIAFLLGEEGIRTRHIPSAFRALEPWLRSVVSEPRFWDRKYDPKHQGSYVIEPMSTEERAAFFGRFRALPHLLEGKQGVKMGIWQRASQQ